MTQGAPAEEKKEAGEGEGGVEEGKLPWTMMTWGIS
jgi:hypothetical protein